MNPDDVIGLIFLIVMLSAIAFGIRRLIRPGNVGDDEHARRIKESSGIAGSVMNSLNKAFQPRANESVAVQQDLRKGHYNKRERAEEE